jgi:uncharacterized protein (TIGR02599 family)
MYGRMSSLRFVSGPMSLLTNGSGDPTVRPTHGVFFQAPFGIVNSNDGTAYASMENLLNTWGYFVEAGYDLNRPSFLDPAMVPKRWRSRLIEYRQPTEQMQLYDSGGGSYGWFNVTLGPPGSGRPTRVLAENILALILIPKLSKGDEDARVANGAYPNLTPGYIYDSTLTLNPGPGGLTPGPGSGSIDLGGINPKNQLPPIISVTMIAVDERSAIRMNEKSPDTPLMGMDAAAGRMSYTYNANYQDTNSLFTDPKKLEDDPVTNAAGDGDIYKFEQILTNEKLTYRVFTTNVTIRGAKWSRAQTK